MSTEAGWTVAPTIRTSLNDSPGYLSIFVTGENLETTAGFICQSFKAVSIDCRPEKIQENSIGGTRDTDVVYVVVGRSR